MALAAADANDLALFMSDDDSDNEEDDGMVRRMGPTSTPSESCGHSNEQRLRHQLSQQLLEPLAAATGGGCSSSSSNSVVFILERIRSNANDEVPLQLVLSQLQRLPNDPKMATLIDILANLREEYAPKDAIMSIWYKLLHPKMAKRVKSAGTIPIIRSRLLESKRKQAECDLQLLQNRISLLQQEESRAWKKIVQTKDRAQEVMGIREENVKKHAHKSHLQLEKDFQTRFIQKKQFSLKKESVIKKKHAAIQLISKKYQDVEIVKQESKRLKEEKEKQQILEVQKAQEKRHLIRKQEEALKQKKQMEKHAHDQQVALRYMKKVIDEERRIKDHQKRVEEMEKQEKELIQRLQGTQLIQQEAFSVLEKALLQTEPSVLGGLGHGGHQHPRPATAHAMSGGGGGTRRLDR